MESCGWVVVWVGCCGIVVVGITGAVVVGKGTVDLVCCWVVTKVDGWVVVVLVVLVFIGIAGFVFCGASNDARKASAGVFVGKADEDCSFNVFFTDGEFCHVAPIVIINRTTASDTCAAMRSFTLYYFHWTYTSFCLLYVVSTPAFVHSDPQTTTGKG